MPLDPVYVEEQGWLVHRYELVSTNVLRFGAQEIHRERTGIHAKISISLNWITLAYSVFNIDRDEDRVRLANSGYGHLDAKENALDVAECTKSFFKHALDLFCLGLWEETIGSQVGGLMAGDPNIKPARPLVGKYVYQEAGTILYAPPGTGKSYTAKAMAVSCAWGIEDIWRLGESWLPLYINVERSASSMAGRLARVNVALGLDPIVAIPFLNARGRSLADIYEAAQRTLKKEGCAWIIYDSISRAGFGSMVSDDVANKIMDMLNALCPTWLALAHSPRADDSHPFGSQMFTAAADIEVQLRAQIAGDKKSTGISLEVTKANDAPTGSLGVHVLEWDEDGLAGIRKASVTEFADLAAEEKMSKEDLMIRLIRKVGRPMSGTAIADSLGINRSTVANILTAGRKFVFVKQEGKEALYGERVQTDTS